MKYYLAGRVTNSEIIGQIIQALQERGQTCTFDWTAQPSLRALLDAQGCITPAYRAAASLTAQAELEGVTTATMLLVMGDG